MTQQLNLFVKKRGKEGKEREKREKEGGREERKRELAIPSWKRCASYVHSDTMRTQCTYIPKTVSLEIRNKKNGGNDHGQIYLSS